MSLACIVYEQHIDLTLSCDQTYHKLNLSGLFAQYCLSEIFSFWQVLNIDLYIFL